MICGVDVSKDWLDAYVRPVGLFQRFGNDAAGIGALADLCRAQGVELVAMEASGGFERPAFLLLSELGVGCGLIRRVVTTPANANDTVVADRLIGDEACVMADCAYHTHAREQTLKDKGIKPRLMRRPNRHHRALPPRLEQINRLISRRRAAVETTFATLKHRMGLSLIRYRGLAKAEAQVLMAAIAFNMRRWVTMAA
jgi:transposase